MSETVFKDHAITFFNCDDGSWKNYDKVSEFIEFISPVDGMELSASHTDVFVKSLPFYENVDLLHVATQGWEGENIFYFFLEDHNTEQYIMLKGESDVIHDLNSTDVLRLNSDNLIDYLKFFCQFIKDDEGECFFLVENEHSETIDGLSAYDKSRYLRKFEGTMVTEFPTMFKFHVKTRVYHTGNVYDSLFEIKKDGAVEMLKDVLVGSV